LAQNLLALPYAHSGIALFQKLHLHPAHRNPALGLTALHDIREFLHRPAALDGPRCDAKPGRDFFVSAL